MASKVDFASLVGKLWKCPASFWGEEYAKDVQSDEVLDQFKWVKLKKFVPAKIVKNRATAACFIFDCQDERNNYIPVSEIDLDDIKDDIEGLTLFCFAFVLRVFIKRACFYKHRPHLCADDESDSEEEEEVN